MNYRTSIARDGGAADTFGYDLNEQSTTATQGGVPSTFTYDANGNRNDNTNYVVNSLNQYTKFNGTTISYDNKGNVTSDGSGTYIYDAQNRMTSATVGTVSTAFLYDGYNRKFSRAETVSGTTTTTVNVWDGWNLIEECNFSSSTPTYTCFNGMDGIEERLGGSTSPLYYFHDALGSVSHVTDASGNLKEWYKYDRFGAVTIYDSLNNQLSTSNFDVRHLFTNQLWMPAVGLYDYRFRVYSQVLQRFMQTDPIGFDGDGSALYRYCENDPVNASDFIGLITGQIGYGGNIHFGPWGFSGSVGFVFDGHGNIGFYASTSGVRGVGLNAGTGPVFGVSNGDVIQDISGSFATLQVSAGEAFGGRVAVSHGVGSHRQPVTQVEFSPEADVGVSAGIGVSDTGIIPLHEGSAPGTFFGYNGQIFNPLPGETTIGGPGPIEFDPFGQRVYDANGYFPDQTFNPDGSPVGSGGNGGGTTGSTGGTLGGFGGLGPATSLGGWAGGSFPSAAAAAAYYNGGGYSGYQPGMGPVIVEIH